MIILMILELKYSEFYLYVNTRDQAKIVYGETRKLLESSPIIRDKFDIKRDVITCKLNQNTLKVLSSDADTLDCRRVSSACIDEVGAAKMVIEHIANLDGTGTSIYIGDLKRALIVGEAMVLGTVGSVAKVSRSKAA